MSKIVPIHIKRVICNVFTHITTWMDQEVFHPAKPIHNQKVENLYDAKLMSEEFFARNVDSQIWAALYVV